MTWDLPSPTQDAPHSDLGPPTLTQDPPYPNPGSPLTWPPPLPPDMTWSRDGYYVITSWKDGARPSRWVSAYLLNHCVCKPKFWTAFSWKLQLKNLSFQMTMCKPILYIQDTYLTECSSTRLIKNTLLFSTLWNCSVLNCKFLSCR